MVDTRGRRPGPRFSLGMMSVPIVVLITLLIFVEKSVARGRQSGRQQPELTELALFPRPEGRRFEVAQTFSFEATLGLDRA